jgi:hypothetical protein
VMTSPSVRMRAIRGSYRTAVTAATPRPAW